MSFDLIWHIIVLFVVGKLIIRIGGRKSISQMTATQTVAMLGLGTILVHPITSNNVITTLLTMLTIIIIMMIFEYLQMKFDFLETFFNGKSLLVIENGKLNMKNMKRIRMTVDALENYLRQSGISSIDDVLYATIEVSGELGYKLKPEKEPVTKGDLDMLTNEIHRLNNSIISKGKKKNSNSKKDIFKEIKDKPHEGNKNEL